MTDLSEQDLDHLATVTPTDIRRAQAAWRASVPEPLKDLLDAGDDEQGAVE